MVESEQARDAADKELYLLHLEFVHGADVWYLLPSLCYGEFFCPHQIHHWWLICDTSVP